MVAMTYPRIDVSHIEPNFVDQYTVPDWAVEFEKILIYYGVLNGFEDGIVRGIENVGGYVGSNASLLEFAEIDIKGTISGEINLGLLVGHNDVGRKILEMVNIIIDIINMDTAGLDQGSMNCTINGSAITSILERLVVNLEELPVIELVIGDGTLEVVEGEVEEIIGNIA